MAVYIASSESSKPKSFFRRFLSPEWTTTWPSTKLYCNEKMVVVPVFSNGLCCYYSEVLESLPFLAFRRDVDDAIFLKYSKEGRSTSSKCGNSKCSIRFLLQILFEKQDRCKVCKKNSRHCCVKCKVDIYDICLYVLKYFMDISYCLTGQRKVRKCMNW